MFASISGLLKKTSVLTSAVSLLLLVASASTAAGEKHVNYPILPTGYSSIKVYDRQGRFVGRILPENRYWVPIERIPPFLQKALVAIEDSRFFEHSGIDVRGIARALVKDVIKGKMAEGGSTITQQLIKNKYLSGEKTIDRKLKEAQMAMEFERKYSKRQILEMYFNEIYFGNGAWGIAQAARLYFDKSPEELTNAECVLLAGVPKAPGKYNPMGKPADVTARRDLVLNRMVELGMLSPRERQKLRAERVTFVPRSVAPQYLGHIRRLLADRYGPDVVHQGGLDVIAAMDLNFQKAAEQTLKEGVKRLSPGLQGALLCLEPATGDVLAAVGGVDDSPDSYNRAFVARRQPGSAVKPLIFAAALEQGITPASIWNDSPVAYDRGNGQVWRPRNYGNEVRGELTLRQALAYSNNVITVKLLETLGVPYFTDFAGKMGLSLHPDKGLSLALGTEEVTLKELVAAYTPFANGGLRSEPRSIIRIYDRRRRVWTENPPALSPVLSPAAAFVMTRMMRDVMTYGTAKGLRKFALEHPSAGKTGTTDDYKDAWFVGYTPGLVAGVWVGYDKPRPGGRGFTGGAVSAPIWGNFMRSVVKTGPAADFPQPETVVSVTIDPATGFLASPDCPSKRDEFFIAGTQPNAYCPKHGGDALQPPASAASPVGAESGAESAAPSPEDGSDRSDEE